MTSPTSVAVGATNAVAWTWGVRPSNENNGISRLLQERPRHCERMPGVVTLGNECGIGNSSPMHKHAAVFAGGARDAIGRRLRSERPVCARRQREIDEERRVRGHLTRN